MLTGNDSLPSGGTVFLYDFFHVDRPLTAVKDALVDGEAKLGALASRAVAEGDELRIRIGLFPSGTRVGKQVRVELGEPYERAGIITFPLRWEATGARGLFPVLHGDLELARLGPDRTHVALSARYDPPLGSIGRLLDEKLLHHVAQASARSFLRGLEASIGPVETLAS